jgi:hypothetical protein
VDGRGDLPCHTTQVDGAPTIKTFGQLQALDGKALHRITDLQVAELPALEAQVSSRPAILYLVSAQVRRPGRPKKWSSEAERKRGVPATTAGRARRPARDFGRLPGPPGLRRPRVALPQWSLSARRSGGERRRQRPSGWLGRLSESSQRRGPGAAACRRAGRGSAASQEEAAMGQARRRPSAGPRCAARPRGPSCTRSWRSSARRSRSSGCRCGRRRIEIDDEMQHPSRVWQLSWQHSSGSSAGWSSRRSSAAFVLVSPRTRCTHRAIPERRPSRRATRSWRGSSGRSIRTGSCRRRSGAGGLTRRRRPTSTAWR